MAGISPFEQAALLGLVILCAFALLLSMRKIRRKLRVRRGARIIIWSVIAALVVVVIAAQAMTSIGGGEFLAGSGRAGQHR